MKITVDKHGVRKVVRTREDRTRLPWAGTKRGREVSLTVADENGFRALVNLMLGDDDFFELYEETEGQDQNPEDTSRGKWLQYLLTTRLAELRIGDEEFRDSIGFCIDVGDLKQLATRANLDWHQAQRETLWRLIRLAATVTREGQPLKQPSRSSDPNKEVRELDSSTIADAAIRIEEAVKAFRDLGEMPQKILESIEPNLIELELQIKQQFQKLSKEIDVEGQENNSATGGGKRRKKQAKRKPGRKKGTTKHSPENDQKIVDVWKKGKGGFKKKDEVDIALKLKPGTTHAAVDRHRKRRK